MDVQLSACPSNKYKEKMSSNTYQDLGFGWDLGLNLHQFKTRFESNFAFLTITGQIDYS